MSALELSLPEVLASLLMATLLLSLLYFEAADAGVIEEDDGEAIDL
jgi:hypothetical protein